MFNSVQSSVRKLFVLMVAASILGACATKKPEPPPQIDEAAQRQAAYEAELIAVLDDWRDDALEDTVAALQGLTERYPEGLEGWVNMGVAYYRQGDYERAKRALNQALTVDANNKVALNYSG